MSLHVAQADQSSPAMVRVTEDGRLVGLFEREAFIADNLDGIDQDDRAAIRAGRAVRIGGGAAPVVDIEPVTQ